MPTDRPGHPYAQTAIARFLGKRIEELRGVKTQREIALEVGYPRPNVISMFKTGELQVPLPKIPALARALDADAGHLFRLAMTDQWPELAPVIGEIFGRQLASANEGTIFLGRWRAATDELDPPPNARINAAVDEMLLQLFAGR